MSEIRRVSYRLQGRNLHTEVEGAHPSVPSPNDQSDASDSETAAEKEKEKEDDLEDVNESENDER